MVNKNIDNINRNHMMKGSSCLQGRLTLDSFSVVPSGFVFSSVKSCRIIKSNTITNDIAVDPMQMYRAKSDQAKT